MNQSNLTLFFLLWMHVCIGVVFFKQQRSNDAPAAQTAAVAKPKGTAAGGGAVLEMLEGQFGGLNRRGRVALELLTTERVYCECLTSTINAFLIPLRTGLCPTFDRRYLPTIFVNIDKILAANTKFLHEIEYLVVCFGEHTP